MSILTRHRVAVNRRIARTARRPFAEGLAGPDARERQAQAVADIRRRAFDRRIAATHRPYCHVCWDAPRGCTTCRRWKAAEAPRPAACPTAIDRAWKLGYDLGREGERPTLPRGAGEAEAVAFSAGWDQGFAAWEAEEEARFEAWVIEQERLAALDGAWEPTPEELAECGSLIGHPAEG